MKKKLLSLALALAMALSLAACGNGSSSGDSTIGSGSQTASDGSITIKIGGIGPLTGSNATYGLATYYGAQIAVDEINALDSNIKLEYRFEDDTGVNETAVSAYSTLKDWDVDVIYGCTTTGPCVAVAAETFADRYFQITPSASSPDVTDSKDNVFQMCFTDPNQGVTAANYVKDNNLATKVGVIYNNGDSYSTGIAQGFIEEAEELWVWRSWLRRPSPPTPTPTSTFSSMPARTAAPSWCSCPSTTAPLPWCSGSGQPDGL